MNIPISRGRKCKNHNETYQQLVRSWFAVGFQLQMGGLVNNSCAARFMLVSNWVLVGFWLVCGPCRLLVGLQLVCNWFVSCRFALTVGSQLVCCWLAAEGG